jgi:hypothetical protein
MVGRKSVVGLLMAFTLSGCASFRVPIQTGLLPEPKPKTLSAVYSTSYFQERFISLGQLFASAILLGPVLTNLSNPANFNEDAEKMRKSRMDSSAYERLLGDFEVSKYFAGELVANANQLQHLSVQFADSDKQMSGVIERAKSSLPLNTPLTTHVNDDRFSATLALKFSYGIGPRRGNEQMGFVKKSRTYVRVLGVLKKEGTSDILWRDELIVFGDKPYTSKSGKAENLDRQELVDSFKDISKKLVDLLIQDLNGIALPPNPILLITNDDDTHF